MKKITVSVIGLFMAVLMAIGLPLNVFAANESIEYVSEIRICYGTPDKVALEKQGYKVFDSNLNETGDGKEVYLCYKTTNDRSDAITDIAVMNMKGAYSFDKYQLYVQTVLDEAKRITADFIIAVNEFISLYQADHDSPTVKATLRMFNTFYDEDITGKIGSEGKLLGDMIIDGTMTSDELTKIFYQGNTKFVQALENALCLGLTEIGEDTFLTRLASAEYTDNIDASKNVQRTKLMSHIAEAKEYYLKAETYAKAAEKYGSTEEYLKQFGEIEKSTVADYITSYKAAVAHNYGEGLFGEDGETPLTFFDVITLPTQDEFDEMLKNGEVTEDDYCMDVYMADMLLRSLTDGQTALLTVLELRSLVNDCHYLGESKNPEADLNSALSELDSCGTASIFDGVDRTLLTHPEDVAMTYAATTNRTKADYSSLGRKDMKCALGMKICGIIFASSIGVGILWGLAAVALVNFVEKERAKVEYAISLTVAEASGIGYTVGIIVAVVCLVALILTAIFSIVRSTAEPPKVTYTKIPRAIVDSATVDSKEQFYNYYCAKLVDAVDGYDDYMNIYGDLNGNGGHSEWLCLYYTKDTRVGYPISEDFITTDVVDTSMNKSTGYLPVSLFGTTGVEDLNFYNNSIHGTKKIYLYAQYADDSLKGSFFTDNTFLVNIIFFVVGAGIATTATVIVMKRKKTKVPTEA